MRLSLKQVLAGLVLLVTAGVTITVVDEGSGPTHRRSVTIHIDGPDRDTKRDDKLVLSPPAQKVEQAPGADLLEPQRGPDKTAAGVIHGPLASQEWPGCKTAFVKAFSRRTSTIKAIALHFTAGPNVAGWADVDGLTAYSNNLGNQVSWHFSDDREGNCAYNVPLNQKAWTISGLNSQTVNIEGVGTGKEPDYLDSAGFKRLEQIVWRIGAIEHVPMRVGYTTNCGPSCVRTGRLDRDGPCGITSPGIVTHWMGGTCSGGHVDIKPYDLRAIVARIASDQERQGGAAAQLQRARRSHRIVHAKIAKRCRGHDRHSSGCRQLFKRNGELHAKYGKELT